MSLNMILMWGDFDLNLSVLQSCIRATLVILLHQNHPLVYMLLNAYNMISMKSTKSFISLYVGIHLLAVASPNFHQ